jgi:hypothetical protein
MTTTSASARSHRPRSYTVFGAALVAGAAVAFGVNSILDAHLARVQPRVESEPILVAIRTLHAGAPVTVWDVALRDWPKAMVPSSAMRLGDDLDNLVVRHPLREGQPILAVQLARVDPSSRDPIPQPVAAVAAEALTRAPERDLWEPESPSVPPTGAVGVIQPAVAAPPVAIAARAPQPPAPSSPVVTVPSQTPATTAVPSVQSPPRLPAESITAPSQAAVTSTPLELPEIPAAPRDSAEDRPGPAPERLAALPLPSDDQPAKAEPAPATPVPVRSAQKGQTSARAESVAQRPNPSSIQFRSVPDREALRADVKRVDSVPGEEGALAPTPKPVTATTSVLAPKQLPTAHSPATGRQRGQTAGQVQGSGGQPRSGQAKPPVARNSQRSSGFTKGYRST